MHKYMYDTCMHAHITCTYTHTYYIHAHVHLHMHYALCMHARADIHKQNRMRARTHTHIKLTSDLRGDLGVWLCAQQQLERLLLLRRDLCLVVLRESEQALLPQDGRGRVSVAKGGEVVDKAVDDAVR